MTFLVKKSKCLYQNTLYLLDCTVMKNLRGGTHTTLTETAARIVRVLEETPGVTRISPGIITQNGGRSGKSYVTAVITNAGLELIVTGQGVQKVAVHCQPQHTRTVLSSLKMHKKLSTLIFKVRERKPGI